MTYDIIIVGAGISGAVLAERYASELNKKVLVLEKRNHIGGNCYDYYNEAGIRVSKYGAHIFHTSYEDVWEYVNRFSSWYPYEHKVLGKVEDKLVPIPVNINTVNMLCGTNIQTEEEMKKWLSDNQIHNPNPQNGKEAALARVGPVLYEKIFRTYTKKQWNKYPEELDAEVLNRIPVRTNYEDRYFTDFHQALPEHGYTPIFEKMLAHPNITIQLNTDFFSIKDQLSGHEKIFYTGPIDQYFDYKHESIGKLEYRSIRFEDVTLDQEYFQVNSVVNYPGPEVEFTRIVEYKHFTRQKHPKTTIAREYSTDEGEPYYPVPNPKNRELYERYREEANKLESQGVHFVGRLANYKYFNMDQAFKNALDLFNKLENPGT